LRLWIRADASAAVGLGHLTRTLALAEEAQARILPVGYVVVDASVAGPQLDRAGVAWTTTSHADDLDWLGTVAPGDMVVFDGYDLGPRHFAAAAAAGARVTAIDDFGRGRFDVDVLVHPNPVAAVDYETPASATVLCGPRYALVRRRFLRHRRLRAGRAGVLLISMGGSDAAGVTEVMLDALVPARPFERVLLAVGPAAREVATSRFGPWLDVRRDAVDVAATFDEADAAVIGAGTTTWELLAMGVPTALVQVADNQRHVMRAATHERAALAIGAPADLATMLIPTLARLADPSAQRALSESAMALVDGGGPARVLDALLSPA
jgi:spore coat polysaccharide biosynthesis predicted glycosyltransferase SpsG